MAHLIHERKELVAPHGDTLRLDVRRPAGGLPDSAVLVAHGFKGFKDWGFFPYLSEKLAEAGHLVVSFNFSLGGVGADLLTFSDLDAFRRNTFSRELDDLLWLLDELASGTLSGGNPVTRTGLLGHSRGGGASVLGAVGHDHVGALVTWAAISSFDRWTADQQRDWDNEGVTYFPNARTGQDMPVGKGLWDDFLQNQERLDILAAASAIAAPWLIVHGADDKTVPLREAQALQEASGAALAIVPDTGHTFGATHPMGAPPAPLDTAIDRSVAHFRSHLS